MTVKISGTKGINRVDPDDNNVLVEIVVFALGNVAPPGTIKANGALLSRTAYANLFSRIGTTFGAGDGVNTFRIPDLRGEFLRCFDDGRGVDLNRINLTGQKGSGVAIDPTGSFTAYLTELTSIGISGSGDINLVAERTGVDVNNDYSYQNTDMNYSIADYVQTSSAWQIGVMRPRNIALLACIKY